MKVVRFVHVCICFLICHSLSAQVPGVLGKRVSIHYNLAVSPSLGRAIPYEASRLGPYTGWSEDDKFHISRYVRHRHQGGLEFALSRKWGIGVDYFHQRGGYSSIDNNGRGFTNDINYNPYFSRNFIRNSYGLFLKKYKVSLRGYESDEGSLAPIGYYWEGKVFLSKDRYELKGNPDLFDGYDVILSSKKVDHIGFSCKIGRHILLFDRFILDFGGEFGFLIPTEFDRMGAAPSVAIFFVEHPLHPFDHISMHHLFNLHIGIGYAIF